ncbi:MAG: C-terminal binding protein [Gammaproteobacteria bacterium]|nr:C-terminal binding protein [Gammaproteobacteria bacterium]MYE49909.1 C-terminal binding protein [Gammaproteobacteria bacterium]MYF48698.1 C-terminal binding protein [Gammaproteobacteria bacterium]
MPFNVLYPFFRWGRNRDVELASMGETGRAEFSTTFEEVSVAQWAACDAIVTVADLPEGCRAQLRQCRIVVTPKVGFDNFDLAAWAELGIPLCNVPDYGTQEVADHAMALMLSLMKGITFHTRELKASPREHWRPALNPHGRRLSACTFGIVGLGRIGTAAALRAKAFGMDVVFYDPYLSNGVDLAIGVRRVHALDELFATSDVVSVHAPLSPETERMIDARVLAASKPGLILINTARGPIVDLAALAEALRKGQVQAAGLDVLPEEPADPEHPLIKAWANDEDWVDHRLLITPHSAFFTPESAYDMRFKGGEIALTYLAGGRLQNCVNQHLLDQRS